VVINIEIELEKIFTSQDIEISNIYYGLDSTQLRPESYPALDTLLALFRENPDITIEIGSHTDSRGSDAHNLKLSQGRAQSVIDYLISKGIAAERLIAKGYGETKLLNNCGNNVKCTEEEHQRNRRTTFRVISQNVNIESKE
jgi:outer membrane protein OmpA-like peptidoglycan-associated protein